MTWDGEDVSKVDGRYVCLIKSNKKRHYQAVICESKLSPSRKFIELGHFHSDDVTGWYPCASIEVLEILRRVELPAPSPRGLLANMKLWWDGGRFDCPR